MPLTVVERVDKVLKLGYTSRVAAGRPMLVAGFPPRKQRTCPACAPRCLVLVFLFSLLLI